MDEKGDTKKLSKNAQKKLAKGKKQKKEKPKWGEGKKKKDVNTNKDVLDEKLLKIIQSTKKGDKKSSDVMPDSYNPLYVESCWQDWWEVNGFYKPNQKDNQEKFIMVIPPPNVTGSLHLGHALTSAVEDTLSRWHRMKGDLTLFVPGIDHAGIATQSVVEKMLAKQNLTRHELGRDKFIEKVWEWKHEYGTKITKQLRRMGVSVDWSRERFTMDEMCSKAVIEAFVRFHDSGLLYRDLRLGNWSCALKSAISEIEVDYLELEGRTFLTVKTHDGNPDDKDGKYEFGVLTSFAYQLVDSDEEIIVATTRLETMLGDTAVAIHPEDERYKHLHGKFVRHPFVERTIPIICDSELVDMSFGTGAVKITPSHDPNDYACGKRHKLEFINILTKDGKINENGGQFKGLMRYDARIAVEKALNTLGLFKGKQPNKMRLGICSRSGDVLEPMITLQWYVKCDTMAQKALNAVREKELKIVPSDHERTWFHWLENIRDWCISRQLWWGHRIPAWFCRKKDEQEVSKLNMANNDRWIVARNEQEALVKAQELLQCPSSNILLEQDEDVLDTWFSSGLFPFSVFGWPDETNDLETFYPTTLLETGLDIIFFWVARMVMMGLQLTGKLPFKHVYLHAMVRDKEGRKMSKSLGNVIDPLEVIDGCTLQSLLDKLDGGNLPLKEVQKAKQDQTRDFPQGIPTCGSDALRFGLLAYTVQGRDVNLDIKRVVGYRNFCNKLWNATKFALGFLEGFTPCEEQNQIQVSTIRNKYILSRLHVCCQVVNNSFREYKFGDAQRASYSFWMDDLCDVFLELVKPVLNAKNMSNNNNLGLVKETQATLFCCIEVGLRILHPMMPFVTEELWQRLPCRGETIMLAPFPQSEDFPKDVNAEASMEITLLVIKACRSLRSSYNIANKILTNFYIIASEPSLKRIQEQTDDIMTLGKASSIQMNPEEMPKQVGTFVVSEQVKVLLDLTGLIDFEAEILKLEKSFKKIQPLVKNLELKTSAPGYLAQVSPELKLADEEKLSSLQKKSAQFELAIKDLKGVQI